MDAARFDAFSRSIATRLSRRTAVRGGGAAFLASLLGVGGTRPASARQAGGSWYTIIRRYTLTGPADPVLQELNTGFLPLVSQAEGFISYAAVSSANDVLTTITVFESQALLQQAADTEADWVQANLAALLPAPAEVTEGDAIIYDINTDIVCEDGPDPTAVSTEAPTLVPTAVPTMAPTVEPTPCTGIGCPCNAGVFGACDDGLVCCQSQMGGDAMPGGPGMCAAEDACGDATPST